jgi:hypothetical protein
MIMGCLAGARVQEVAGKCQTRANTVIECAQKKCDTWLAQHPNVHFHFTPTSASWLNQVEIWFGILSRKALRGAVSKTSLPYAKPLKTTLPSIIQRLHLFDGGKARFAGRNFEMLSLTYETKC